MKKLNNKGFTLIELLAIIVILAIIMVVTIPTVLSSMNKARENQLQNAANSVAEWLSKQYELSALGTIAGGADGTFTTWLGASSYTTLSTAKNFGDTAEAKNMLNAAGISDAGTNFDLANSSAQYMTTTGRFCVILKAKDGGSFYNPSDPDANTKKSSGCS